ncbi:hypothetical protein R3P38DRAFT_2797333 [Favolaschia claudopus]|uniref:Uncharacterized protein n=1 Tax=Favolaschia claudopus TaxID=2862362 RepID=A0AAW0A397_9AGAR
MTSFDPPTPGTADSVPGAPPTPSSGQQVDPTIAALAHALTVMIQLSGGELVHPATSIQALLRCLQLRPRLPLPSPRPPLASPPPCKQLLRPPTPVFVPTIANPAPGFRTAAPWLSGIRYLVVPTQHLQAIAEPQYDNPDNAPSWYAISVGHYVGLTLSNAAALAATIGVSGGNMKKFKTQVEALAAFNANLDLGIVAVIP